jgi:rRNA maturation RNase YbeY
MSGVSIKNLTRRKSVPRFAYRAIVQSTLPLWDISLVFVGPTRARALNERMRGKIYVPNVLSYALDEKSGEIIICLREAEKQASSYGMDERTFVLYLFIHGVLHIKGWAHGARMEECERNLLTRFSPHTWTLDKIRNNVRLHLNETTHSHRHRHRHVPSKDGRNRGTHR